LILRHTTNSRISANYKEEKTDMRKTSQELNRVPVGFLGSMTRRASQIQIPISLITALLCLLLANDAAALVPGLALDSSGNPFIANIQLFLDTCPAGDPALTQIRSDFQIRRNGVLVGDIPCSEPISQLPVSQYTDELILLQGLRVIYYMDRGKSGHLPWTAGTLYDWMKSKIQGIDIIDGSLSFCCLQFGGKTYIGVGSQDDFNRDFDRMWEGISGNIELYAHETRHVDGFGHTSCCGLPDGCDQTYDQSNLSPYGIQWWLAKSWLMGDINVGFSCLSQNRIQDIVSWHLASANLYSARFCDNKPPLLAIPLFPGGQCFTAPDVDNDGVPDSLDLCPDTRPGAVVNAEGCSIDQLVPCDGLASGGTWKNHGQYVRAIAEMSDEFRAQGLICEDQRNDIISNAAGSKCGSKAR